MDMRQAFAAVDSHQREAFAAVDSRQREAFAVDRCQNQRPVWEIVIAVDSHGLDLIDGIVDGRADSQHQCQMVVMAPEDTKNRNLRLVAAACPSPTIKCKKWSQKLSMNSRDAIK